MLPIACKWKGRGCYLGTQPIGGGGGVERRRTGIYIWCDYIYIYVIINIYDINICDYI